MTIKITFKKCEDKAKINFIPEIEEMFRFDYETTNRAADEWAIGIRVDPEIFGAVDDIKSERTNILCFVLHRSTTEYGSSYPCDPLRLRFMHKGDKMIPYSGIAEVASCGE